MAKPTRERAPTKVPIIKTVRARPVLAPMPRLMQTASGKYPCRRWCSDIHTDQGVPGRARLWLCGTGAEAALQFIDEISGMLLGKPAAQLERLGAALGGLKLLGTAGPAREALSGIHVAYATEAEACNLAMPD